jgi:hypothetical protein
MIGYGYVWSKMWYLASLNYYHVVWLHANFDDRYYNYWMSWLVFVFVFAPDRWIPHPGTRNQQ